MLRLVAVRAPADDDEAYFSLRMAYTRIWKARAALAPHGGPGCGGLMNGMPASGRGVVPRGPRSEIRDPLHERCSDAVSPMLVWWTSEFSFHWMHAFLDSS